MTALPVAPKPIASPAQSSAPDRFTTCIAFTWRAENDGQPFHVTPGDHGGATAWGVTLAAFQAWRLAHRLSSPSAADLRAASKSELATLIRTNYWNSVQADHLPSGVDLCVYDFGFGSGPVTSVEQLQRVLVNMGEYVAVDGEMGPATLAAACRVDRETLIMQLGARHAEFYSSLGQPAFVRGWIRRNGDRVREAMG